MSCLHCVHFILYSYSSYLLFIYFILFFLEVRAVEKEKDQPEPTNGQGKYLINFGSNAIK